jgi:hypothetical protein
MYQDLHGDLVMSPDAHGAHPDSTTVTMVFLATSAHAASYLLATGSLAFLVFEKLGIEILRKAWVNFDLIWAAALVITGLANIVL